MGRGCQVVKAMGMDRTRGGAAVKPAPELVVIDAVEAEATPVRAVVVGGSYLEREGLVALLTRAAGVELVGAFEDQAAVLAAIETERPDVVVVDVGFGPSAGGPQLDTALEIRARNPYIGFILLTGYQRVEAAELFRHGAAGVALLQKHSLGGSKRLLQAIEEVAAGGSLFDPKSIDSLLAKRDGTVHDGLTPRELDVLTLIARGRNNAAIARILSLTERAVEKHINSIYRKLGIHEDSDQHPRVAAVLAFLTPRTEAGES